MTIAPPQDESDDSNHGEWVPDGRPNEQQLHAQAIQASTQGIIITNAEHADNPIIYASPGFERLTGYSIDEVLGRNCRFLQGADTDRLVVDEMRQAVQAGRPFVGDVLNYRKDGTPFWNEVSIKPERDTTGRLVRFVWVFTDVSIRKNREIQLEQSQTLQAVGKLVGGIAHDFNNLLTVINGSSDMALLETPPEHPLRGWLTAINEAGGRAVTLTKQLLAFSRNADVARKL